MLLFLDTTQNNIIIALRIPRPVGCFLIKKKNISAKFQQAEKLLPAIDKFLQQHKIGVGDVQGIAVVAGPGRSLAPSERAGFTSLRIGLAVANTLGYSLNIPVHAVKSIDGLVDIKISKNEKFKKLVLPVYGKEPNIVLKPET